VTTLSISPATGTDDGQSGTGTGYTNSAGNIQLGGYFGTANGWFRTPNVTISGDATISNLTLTGDKLTSAGTAELIFKFVKEANPTYPTSGTDYDGRTLTTASVIDSESGTGAYTSPNLATPGQEIIDQGGWSSGNAQMLFVKDNNSNATHGGFENRIQLRAMESAPSTIPALNWTYSVPITAPLVVGSVTLTGVAPTTKKQAPLAVGSVTFTGVATTAVLPVRADLAIGSVTFSGVSPSTAHSDFLPVGEVEFGARPRNAKQEISFGGATFGNLFISCAGVFSFAVQSVTASAAQWQTAINNQATVTSISGGIRFTFDQSPHSNKEIPLISIDINTSDGTPIVSHLVHGRGYPVTVRKEAPAPIGSVTFTGVAPTATHQAPLTVGTVTLTGVTPGASKVAALAIGSVTFTGVEVNTRITVNLAIGIVTITGVEATVFIVAPKFPGSGTFVSAGLCGEFIHDNMTGGFARGEN